MTLRYAIENPLELEPELLPLLPAHMAEFDIYGPPLHSKPNLEAYRKIASSGYLSCVTVRDDDELVGYWLGLITLDPHHTFMENDVVWQLTSMNWFILPEWRAKAAVGLFNFIDNVASEHGITLLGQRVRPTERTATFLEAIGYRKAETMYVKAIGRARSCQINGGGHA